MSISHATDNPEVDTAGGDPTVVADLEQKLANLTEEADQYAQMAHNCRADSARLVQMADGYEQAGLAIRARGERYRRLIAWEKGAPADLVGDVVNDHGDVQTAVFPRPAGIMPYPLACDPETGVQRRLCNGCQGVLRQATPDEVAATAAGRDLPDVRRECPDCRLNAAAERRTMPYPPVSPDAA